MSNLFNSIKVTELLSVWKRAANLVYLFIYLFIYFCLLRYACSFFPLNLDKLKVLIRPVPELSLQI